MMLFSYLKSYKKGLFNHENKCAVKEEEIEKYIQILLPKYIFTNDAQSNKASIACIIPSILSIIHANLDRIVLSDEDQNLFRNNLICFLKQKFEFELTSKIYLVAALLNVETLKEWMDRTYYKAYIARGLECLLEVVKIFEDKNNPTPLECPVRETFDKNSNEISVNNTSRKAGFRQLSRLKRSNSSQDVENLQDKKVQEEIN